MVDIYIHSNCINTNFIDNIAFIKCKKKNIIITEKNAGFINGGLEAVSDIIDLLKLYSENCEYDYVIHMHPDVFIINETLIVNFLNDQKSISEIIFYVNLSLNNIILYSFDFFIFKPKLLKENIFNKWINNTKSPEEYFHDILINNNIIHCIIPRYDNNFYLPRRIDLIGLWHDHDLYRLYFKLLSDEINKILPIEYSIEEFIIQKEYDCNTIWLEVGKIHFYKYTNNIMYYYDLFCPNLAKLECTKLNGRLVVLETLDEVLFNKDISFLNINYNNYNKTNDFIYAIKNKLINKTIIIINNLYNLIDGDFKAIYEFIHKLNIKYTWLGLHKQSCILELSID